MLGAIGATPLGRNPLGQFAGHVPVLAGLIVGMRSVVDPNPMSYVLPEPLLVDLFAWGAGGGGGTHTVAPTGGGGGAAGYSRMLLAGGDTINWSLGPDTRGARGDSQRAGSNGVDTVVMVGSRIMTAQGGRGAIPPAPAARSIATGFDVNRYGGGSGERGEFGAAPSGSSGIFDGGGAGGFMDMFPGLMQARGMPYVPDGTQGALYAAQPGTGGGGKGSTTDGNDATWIGGGLFLALMYRV